MDKFDLPILPSDQCLKTLREKNLWGSTPFPANNLCTSGERANCRVMPSASFQFSSCTDNRTQLCVRARMLTGAPECSALFQRKTDNLWAPPNDTSKSVSLPGAKDVPDSPECTPTFRFSPLGCRRPLSNNWLRNQTRNLLMP